jgi:hypothetical protein
LLRWSDYRELGELKGALAKHAEAVFGTLQPHEQKAFPVVMRYLVTLSQNEEEVPNRRTVPYHDFVTSEGIHHDHNAGAKGFVDLFVKERLLVADTNPHGEGRLQAQFLNAYSTLPCPPLPRFAAEIGVCHRAHPRSAAALADLMRLSLFRP